MDLLRQVLSRQRLDKLFTLPKLLRSPAFIETRSTTINGVALKLGFYEYVAFCSVQLELSRVFPLFQKLTTGLDEACFQLDAKSYIGLTNCGYRYASEWRALATGVPEIQARALSLISQINGYGEESEGDFTFGNPFQSPHTEDILNTPWTSQLFEAVLRSIKNLRQVEWSTFEGKGFFIPARDFTPEIFVGTAWRRLGFQLKVELDPWLEEILARMSLKPSEYSVRILIESGYLYPLTRFPAEVIYTQNCYDAAVNWVATPILSFMKGMFSYSGDKAKFNRVVRQRALAFLESGSSLDENSMIYYRLLAGREVEKSNFSERIIGKFLGSQHRYTAADGYFNLKKLTYNKHSQEYRDLVKRIPRSFEGVMGLRPGGEVPTFASHAWTLPAVGSNQATFEDAVRFVRSTDAVHFESSGSQGKGPFPFRSGTDDIDEINYPTLYSDLVDANGFTKDWAIFNPYRAYFSRSLSTTNPESQLLFSPEHNIFITLPLLRSVTDHGEYVELNFAFGKSLVLVRDGTLWVTSGFIDSPLDFDSLVEIENRLGRQFDFQLREMSRMRSDYFRNQYQRVLGQLTA